MYDFANSGYTTVVVTAVYNAYFVGVVAGRAAWATLAWTTALAVSQLLIMLTAPVVGAYADLRAAKKALLAISTAGCVVFTAALALTGPSSLALAMVLVAASSYFFGTGENLIAAFLPEIADSESLGTVSGWGWGLGYIGGLLSLGICLAYVTWAQGQGHAATEYVPVTMLITAGLFAVAALPTFLILRERAVAQPVDPRHRFVRDSFLRLGHTLRNAARYRDLARFLVCVTVYQAGIMTVVALAAIYAQEALGFNTRDTITMILAVNVTAALGALAFGQVQDRLGHVRTLQLTLLLWIATIACAWLAESRALFWVAANLAGLSLGASQSAARALVGYLSPETRRAEFFGLWGFAVKLSAIIGPMSYGLVSWLSRGDHRLAILVTGAFFVAGLAILSGVDVPRGRRAALADEAVV
ncbi:MAG: MFS transporter [Betaproteobacteria bacterium]|nr:MFS transporter [Betaproteobacteria bacterium]